MIAKAKPVVEENIKEVYGGNMLSEFLKVADLGCSSGSNTLTVVSQMLEAIATASNDLPGNDFNSLFKSLPSFYEEVKKKEREAGRRLGRCFVFGAPGSFYGSLFPNNTMHFFHSSYSLHWLSQVSRQPITFVLTNILA